jgi:hypothetical protein
MKYIDPSGYSYQRFMEIYTEEQRENQPSQIFSIYPSGWADYVATISHSTPNYAETWELYQEAKRGGYGESFEEFNFRLAKQINVPLSLNSAKSFIWHTWINSYDVVNHEVIIYSEKVFHTATLNPSGDWDTYLIFNAVNWLNENSHLTYSVAAAAGDGAKCAYFVRMALEAGGINTAIHPVPARLYGSYLKNWGFTQINTLNYLKGDIAVIQGYPGGTADENGVPYGHIQMYNGTQWLSNFYQNSFWPGPYYQKYQPAFQIYRMNP